MSAMGSSEKRSSGPLTTLKNPPTMAPEMTKGTPAHAKRVRRGHPWAYSNEIRMDAETKALTPGCVVRVIDAVGEALDLGTDDAVLVKGSRVAGLEVLAERLLDG